MPEIDKVELAKRIRTVQEWLIDDWSPGDITMQIMTKWSLGERQAKRYIAKAKAKWEENEEEKIEAKRLRKINKLQKLGRTLQDRWKGTPAGIQAVLRVEREIISLEGIRPAARVELTGRNGQPIQSETTLKTEDPIDYSQLPNEVLQAIIKARKPVNANPSKADTEN